MNRGYIFSLLGILITLAIILFIYFKLMPLYFRPATRDSPATYQSTLGDAQQKIKGVQETIDQRARDSAQ